VRTFAVVRMVKPNRVISMWRGICFDLSLSLSKQAGARVPAAPSTPQRNYIFLKIMLDIKH
jgi:hypothetical protein